MYPADAPRALPADHADAPRTAARASGRSVVLAAGTRARSALVLALVALLAASPFGPAARATDPTPAATVAPAVSPDPTASPDPTSSPAASPSPTSAPSPAATTTPSPAATPTAAPTTAPTATPSAEPTPSAPPATPVPPAVPIGVLVTHTWVDALAPDGSVRSRGGIDSARAGLERFRVYVVRFQVANPGDASVRFTPLLEAGAGAVPTAWSAVPAPDPVNGQPFYVASDEGPVWRVRTEPIATTGLRLLVGPAGTATAAAGLLAAGINPPGAVTLAPGAFTEIAFQVRATADAPWDGAYAFRLAAWGAGAAVQPGGATAAVAMRSRPVFVPAPGQRHGQDVDEPLPLYPLERPAYTSNALAAAIDPAGSTRLRTAANPDVSPHQPYSLVSDACASCHITHSGQGSFIRAEAAPLSGLCFRCHDGSGAASDVKAAFEDAAIPPNDPDTASWYTHPALADTGHATDRADEMQGQENRHATCADCHQPHRADGSRPVATVDGWTAAGSIEGASGVSVTYALDGTVTYAWRKDSAYEYQLCFKCHSGFTTLRTPVAGRESQWAIDKAVELNPSGVSFHPVLGPGTNATTEMYNSLQGTSTVKRWDFYPDSTIRCLNCHANPDALAPGGLPDARFANHASPNRGLLLGTYRDRELLARAEPYDRNDFTLCYLCHVDAPFEDGNADPRPDTRFELHGKHMTANASKGPSELVDIDTDGAGGGNAICAECHFRIHGVTDAVEGQARNERLVNFSPNVDPLDGELSFTPLGASAGTCTLVCHGKDHAGLTYGD